MISELVVRNVAELHWFNVWLSVPALRQVWRYFSVFIACGTLIETLLTVEYRVSLLSFSL
jgi:hypothetical protein